jgi:hypothetical protein
MNADKDLLPHVLGQGAVVEKMDQIAPEMTLGGVNEAFEGRDIASDCRHHVGNIWTLHSIAPRTGTAISIVVGKPYPDDQSKDDTQARKVHTGSEQRENPGMAGTLILGFVPFRGGI